MLHIRWLFVLLAHLYHALMSGLFHGLVLYVILCAVMFRSLASSFWAVGVEELPSDCARVLVDAYMCLLPANGSLGLM